MDTTNNRMEMTAVIQALTALKRPTQVEVTSDSTYVMKGVTEWLAGWKRKNWQTAASKPVKNVDLWKKLDVLVQRHDVKWRWVKGHAGHTENERVDALANRGIDDMLG